MFNSKSRVAGWIVSVLIVALMCLSASFKLAPPDDIAKSMVEGGWDLATMKLIGVVEITIAVLYLIPPTAFLAAVLLTAYLGGAVATHVRLAEPFYMPIVVGVLVWIAYGLRAPALWGLVLGRSSPPSAGS